MKMTRCLAAAFRGVPRGLGFFAFICATIVARSLWQVFSRSTGNHRARAEWLQRTARGTAWWLGLRVTTPVALPHTGLLVANHLSYLDIIVLASLRPCVFVSKAEVKRWPIFGACAELGGTIFVDRTRRGAVAEVTGEMRAALSAGVLLVLFPEGTSSGGASVLPFKSSLLEPALRLGCPVSAAALGYRIAHGSVPDEICYWREMTLLPHLLNVFAKAHIDVLLACGASRLRAGDRKALARELHAEVAALHATLAGSAGEFRVSAAEAIEECVPIAGTSIPAAAEAERA